MFSSSIKAVTLGLAALPSVLAQQPYANTTSSALLSNITVFSPPSNYTVPRTLYARTLLLNQNCETDNVLLATWENYGPNNDTQPYFPIYQSLDGGATWSERSRVPDQVNGWGLRYQPFLYELPEQFGNWSAGTILLAGSSIPDDLSVTQIDLYASTDKGYTWQFVSHIARGGEALPINGLTPVWEPFLMLYQGELVCYYSDQRDPEAGQKLVHQTTTDTYSWGEVVDDVKEPDYPLRPGMTTVSELPFGNWILTFELCGQGDNGQDCSVHYRISQDPLNFNASVDHLMVATDGTIPVSSPYNVWTPTGGPLGTIVVSCGTESSVFLSHDLGASGFWTKVATPEGQSYTRSLKVLDEEGKILIAGGGVLNGENNKVTVSTIDVAPKGPSVARCAAKNQ